MHHAKKTIAVLFLAIGTMISADTTRAQTNASRSEIGAFNYIAAHKNMDNAAVSSFWADDGVSLLPEMPPLIGKTAIAKFLNEAVKPSRDIVWRKWKSTFAKLQ